MSSQHKPKKKSLFGARFTSTLSVALVLFVIGIGALGGLAVAVLADVMREQFTITVLINESAGDKFGVQLADQLKKADYTSRAVYISADSALSIVTKELGESPEEFLGYNPLQPSVEFQLKADYAVNDSILPIIEALQKQGGTKIDSIDYNAALLNAVNANIHRTTIFFSIIAVILLLISMTLVGNTVRLALHSERFLIGTMRLVGATNWFIRRPFVISQMLHGLVAAFVAIASIAIFLYWCFSMSGSGTAVMSMEAMTGIIISPWRLVCVALLLIVTGMLIPAVAAWRATSKYLHCTNDELYLM